MGVKSAEEEARRPEAAKKGRKKRRRKKKKKKRGAGGSGGVEECGSFRVLSVSLRNRYLRVMVFADPTPRWVSCQAARPRPERRAVQRLKMMMMMI
jgi:hypothetical protein